MSMNIDDTPLETLKKRYDEYLNKEQSLFKTSNDEPTPIGCIEEILACVPEEFWCRENARIYDPCCGNGNWHLVAYDILKHRYDRQRDAILSRFFFNDTNEDRLEHVRSTFGRDVNVTCQDFLTATDENRYDMIMANPPYAKLMADGKRASKNHTLIREFLARSLELLNDGGYLVYLIPDNWMSLADRNGVVKDLTAYQFVHLNIHGAKKWFPKIGSSFTWFVLRKDPCTHPFRVEGSFMKTDFSGMVGSQQRSYVPLIYTELVRFVLNKTVDDPRWERFHVETSSDLHKYTKRTLISSVRDDEHSHRLIHTPKQTVYCSRPHKYQDGYKVFISTTDKYSIFVDDCGMTQSIAFVRCSSREDAETKKKMLDHNLYRFLNDICRWGNFNNIRILQKFPVPRDPESIYDSFGISKEEREFIENRFVK